MVAPRKPARKISSTARTVDDRRGDRRPVDPTENVIALVEAAMLRQDDLRQAEAKYNAAVAHHLKEISHVRAEYTVQALEKESQRLDAMREAQLGHVEQMARVREVYSDKLRLAEASRINAIREVDVSSVATATERATQQALVLANQVAASAETLRTLVASTNQANANTLTQITNQLTDRITSVDKSSSDRITNLERSSYEGKGKEAVADPALAMLVQEVRLLRTASTEGTSKSEGHKEMWGWVAAGLTLLISVIGMLGIVISVRLK